MPYIGQPPVTGDTTSSFRLLDNIASFTLTFDGSSAEVVSTVNDTLTFNQHRFVTAQRVTYTHGGGTAIGGLTSGTAYYIIKVDQNTIKLATSAANANNNSAIDLTSLGVGVSHTLNVAFDGINTKFKATYNNGTKAQLSRAGQLLLSINGVIQQPQETSAPTVGFGIDADSTIVFSVAPAVSDVVFGNIIANSIATFDISDNNVDNFTGNGSTLAFTLSKTPANNQNVLVTLDGVVQYPSDTTTTRAYSVTGSTLTFASAPANGVEIQVRHIGFAGATSSAVTGFYGRTGNAVLTSADDINVQNITGVAATFTGNVSIAGTLTYEDVTNVDSVGLITARSGIIVNTGTATTALVVNGNARVTGILTIGTSSITLDGSTDAIRIGSGVTITSSGIVATSGVTTVSAGSTAAPSITPTGDTNTGIFFPSPDTIAFAEGGVEAARFDSSGRFGLGTSSPSNILHIASSNPIIRLQDTDGGRVMISCPDGHLDFEADPDQQVASSRISFRVDDSERARIDGSGRLLIGTSSSPTVGDSQYSYLVVQGYPGGATGNANISLQRGEAAANITSGEQIGDINFTDSAGYPFAKISCLADANAGTNDYPGRLVFSTTADGAASPTERMRLDSSGRLGIGTNSPSARLHAIGDASSMPLVLDSSAANSNSIQFRVSTNVKGYIGPAGNLGGSDNDMGYRVESGNNQVFYIGANERARLDSSGRWLVGTSSSVTGGVTGVAKIQVLGNTSGTAAVLNLGSTSAATSIPSGSGLGYLSFSDNGAGQYAWIACETDAAGGTNDYPGRLVFSTTADGASSPTERMRIDSQGRVNIGTIGTVPTGIGLNLFSTSTADDAGAFSCGNANTTAAACVASFYTATNSTATSNVLIKFGINGYNSGSGQINANGASAAAFGTFSDARLKENIEELPSQWDNIKSLRPVEFDYVESFGGGHQIGFIAQEMQTVYPDAVGIGQDEMLTVTAWSKTEARLVKALQEALERIESLETEVAALKAQ